MSSPPSSPRSSPPGLSLLRCLIGGAELPDPSQWRTRLFPTVAPPTQPKSLPPASSSASGTGDHIVVMVNGLSGGPEDWKYAAERFVERFPDQVFVHRSQCNSSVQTYDGVDVMGERLAAEVRSVVKERKNLRKISFVSHSLGGLIARYAIGRLYEPLSEPESTSGKGNQSKGSGTIAGLEPVNFITTATPHLSSRGCNQLPILFGLSILEFTAVYTAHLLVGRTGRHLYLTDIADGKPPLLVRMVTDCDEAKFISALQSFKRLVVYANSRNDHMVGWRTSSIRRKDELPQLPLQPYDRKYPHIFNYDFGINSKHLKEPDAKIVSTDDMEEIMVRGLTQLRWERVDVCFADPMLRLTAHECIQVKDDVLHSDGKDVIRHLIDHFLL